jgi:hypothetical protein
LIKRNTEEFLDILAFLAKVDKVPLIIGLANLLEQFKVSFDYSIQEAWLEEKESASTEVLATLVPC